MNLSTKFISSAGSLIEILVKQKNKQNLIIAFSKIKNSSKFQIKRSRYLILLLSKLYQKFNKTQTQRFFSLLLQNRIQKIGQVKEKLNNLKKKSKQLAISVILSKSNNLQKNKIRQVFNTLKYKSSLYSKVRSFKILFLINLIKNLQKRFLNDTLRLIKIKRFQVFSQYKRAYLIFDLLTKKGKQFQLQSFQILKQLGGQKLQNKQAQKKMVKSDSNSDFKLQKQYEDKKNLLEAQIASVRQKYQNLRANKQKQLSKLQNELESVKFSFDILAQENQGLQKDIQYRQNSNKDQSRKKPPKQQQKQQKVNINQSVQIKEGKVWRSIFFNLINYLSKEQNELNPEKILENLSKPLVNKSFYSSISDLQQENSILSEILQAYTQQNKTTDLLNTEISLPISCLNRQKRQLYKILECLSRWGSSDMEQLNQIKSSIERLKKINQ